MRKLLPFVVCGLAAVSYSALAADDKTEIDANTKIQGDAKAGSANPGARAGGTTSTDVGTDAKAGAGVAGAGADAKAGVGARGDVTDAPSVNTQDREQAKGKAAVTPRRTPLARARR